MGKYIYWDYSSPDKRIIFFSYVHHLSNEEQNNPYFPPVLIKLYDSYIPAVNKSSADHGNTPFNQSQNYTNPNLVIFCISPFYQITPPFIVLPQCKTFDASDLLLAGQYYLITERTHIL